MPGKCKPTLSGQMTAERRVAIQEKAVDMPIRMAESRF
jgi:hypothetical protein